VVNPLNQEVVTVRGIEPGEYTVNVHYYESKNGKPVDVTVSIVKVNPRAEVVFYGRSPCPQGRRGHRRALHRAARRQRHQRQHLPKTLVERI
jgi:hypothetical protein